MEKLPAALMPEEGTFKYVQIQATDDSGASRLLVRGSGGEYHADVFDEAEAEVQQAGLQDITLHCLGGGRIARQPGKIFVYGYSMGYGRAKHEDTVKILQKEFPGVQVSFSNDGY
eukprot:m.231578 g.231578  ORF g.231578 m.231578 type:complete len:115 (+) comp10873_c0_seq6:90-434(+)